MKYSFRNDYSEGAHERILEALLKTNREQTAGYGEDPYTSRAKDAIRREIGREDADIYFFQGGTQTNLSMIAAALRPHEAVICAHTGHINVHESGAIEATGHKVLGVEAADGKLTPELIQRVLDAHEGWHMVKPRLVYISDSTEIGTIYKRAELEALSACCREKELYLFLDGARLGSALMAEENDVTLKDIARLTDSFYIGGTKNAALFGEAMVLCRDSFKEDFNYQMKQKGAVTAKGRILGIQFLTLFTDGLYYECAANANRAAIQIKKGIGELGYSFLIDSPSNQQFPIFPKDLAEILAAEYGLEIQPYPNPDYRCTRIVTSWATSEEAVEDFLGRLRELTKSRI